MTDPQKRPPTSVYAKALPDDPRATYAPISEHAPKPPRQHINNHYHQPAEPPSPPVTQVADIRRQIESILSLAQGTQKKYASIVSRSMDEHSDVDRKALEELLALLNTTLTTIQDGLPTEIPDSLRPFLRETMVVVQGVLADVTERCQEFVKKHKETAGKEFAGAFMGIVLATLVALVKLSIDCVKRL